MGGHHRRLADWCAFDPSDEYKAELFAVLLKVFQTGFPDVLILIVLVAIGTNRFVVGALRAASRSDVVLFVGIEGNTKN